MKILTTQIALFTTERIEEPHLLMYKIVEKYGMLFDNKATIQNSPMQDNCFAEISTKNKAFVLRVSTLRVDLFINYDYEQEETPVLLYKQNVMNEINKFYKKVMEVYNINRLGVIFTLFEESEKGDKILGEKYLRSTYKPGDKELFIKFNRQELEKKFIFNNLITLQSMGINTQKGEHDGILIQIDYNNVVKDGVFYDKEEMGSYISNAAKKISDYNLKELL